MRAARVAAGCAASSPGDGIASGASSSSDAPQADAAYDRSATQIRFSMMSCMLDERVRAD